MRFNLIYDVIGVDVFLRKKGSDQFLLYYYYDYRYGYPLLLTWLRFYCSIGYVG